VACVTADFAFLFIISLFLVALPFWVAYVVCLLVLPRSAGWRGVGSGAAAAAGFAAGWAWLHAEGGGHKGPSNFEDMWLPLLAASAVWSLVAVVGLAVFGGSERQGGA